MITDEFIVDEEDFTMTEEEHEKITDQTYKLGIIEGLRQSSNQLHDLAVGLFVSDKDKEASEMKTLSKMLLNMSLERRKEYDKNYPK